MRLTLQMKKTTRYVHKPQQKNITISKEEGTETYSSVLLQRIRPDNLTHSEKKSC